ncbi:MAG: hypothetical protein JSU73_14305, partial [candidate division WOR-3 bacterium]
TGFDLNPLNPAVVYISASCSSRVVVGRSTDAGATWRSFVCDSTEGRSGGPVAVDRSDTNVVCCAGYASDRRTFVYRSTDRGETWTGAQAGNGYVPYALLVSSADNRVILVGTYGSGILRSTDAGATWTRTGTMSDYVYCLAETPQSPEVVYASTNLGVYRSADTGRTWVGAGTELGKDVYTVFADPADDSTVYCASRAGMHRSHDRGNSWQLLMTEFPFSRISAIGLAPSDPGVLYVESDDNTVYSSTDNGETWTRCPYFLSCGLICGFLVDPVDPQTVWALEGSG